MGLRWMSRSLALARYERSGYDGASASIVKLGRRFVAVAGVKRRGEYDRIVRDARAEVAKTAGRTGADGSQADASSPSSAPGLASLVPDQREGTSNHAHHALHA